MSAQLAYSTASPAPSAGTSAPAPAGPRRAAKVEGRERIYRGGFAQVRALLPDFTRVPFAFGASTVSNRNLDAIVRRFDPLQGLPAVPVGVVSRRYAMVTHREVLDAAQDAITASGIDPAAIEVEAEVGEYGGRMALSALFPPEYAFDPGDGHALALRLICVNSVDRSTRLRVALGWYRFVCGNGLLVGKTGSDVRETHRGGLSLAGVRKLVAGGLAGVESERTVLRKWVGTPVDARALAEFADATLAQAWGAGAAARLWHIATTGRDCAMACPGEDAPPHARSVKALAAVPGSPQRARTAYDVSQALAWLAKQPGDPAERIERMAQIPQLVSALTGARCPAGALAR